MGRKARSPRKPFVPIVEAILLLARLWGLNQKQLAGALQLKERAISEWKAGRQKPGRRAMEALPRVLSFTREEIERVETFFAELNATVEQRRTAASGYIGDPAPASRRDENLERELGRLVSGLIDVIHKLSGRRQEP